MQPFSISMICGRKSQYVISIQYITSQENKTIQPHTPPKTNIDIQNCRLEKLTPFKCGSYDFFGGVYVKC